MRIAVIGAGAVGGYFGGRLAHGGEDVVFIARGQSLKAIREKGLRIEDVSADFTASISDGSVASTSPAIGKSTLWKRSNSW